MRTLVACAAVVIALLGVRTQAVAQVSISGNLDCGTWVESRKEDRAVAMEHFLVGLLNGMSMGSGIEFWTINGEALKWQQVHLWMDGYCQRYPLSGIYVGAVNLMNERTKNAWDKFQSK